MAALGHVWTAPWQYFLTLLQHWSGAVMCPACLMRLVWTLALMLCADQVPIVSTHSKMRRPKPALPTPGTTVSALRRHALANFGVGFCPRVTMPLSAANLGSVNRSPRTMIAQAIRAILLASATAATFVGRRAIIRVSQSRFVPCAARIE